MSFLNSNNSDYLSARLTKKGRKSIAEGNFVIKYFQVGDSEFDYNFKSINGAGGIPHQKVLSPMDGDQQVKYPYYLSSSSDISYGDPIVNPTVETIKNIIGPAGFVSQYFEYDILECTGTTIECTNQEISMSAIDGDNILVVPDGAAYNSCQYITIAFKTRLACNDVITGSSQSLVYKIISISGNEITLDRTMPDFHTESGYAQVICHNCKLEYPIATEISPACSPRPVDNFEQHDPWSLDIVWSQKPAGLDGVNENLSGYTGNQFTSTKNYLGYTSTSGQTFTNLTGGTITHSTAYTNSFGEQIDVTPEDQRCIAIIHYSELGDITNDPERFFKYEDYIAGEEGDLDDFEVYIPYILYHRNTGSTIGELFTMSATDYYVSSSKNVKPNSNNVRFRYLTDKQGINVGKVFVDKKIIVFDDQELVASLDYKTNRRYTLPAPKFTTVPIDIPTFYDLNPVVLTGETAWVTYMFDYSGTTSIDGMHCNYYGKVTGATSTNIGFKFDVGDFKYMSDSSYFDGYVANKLYALVQVTPTGQQPSSNSWKKVDITSQITGHTAGTLIDPTDLVGYQFVVTGNMYDSASTYDIETYLGTFPTTAQETLPEFGDTQKFPGSIRLVRAIDVEVMNYMINLPSTQFTETQNPTYTSGTKMVTDIALLNENKEALVIAKCAKPITRSGTQVFSVRLDF